MTEEQMNLFGYVKLKEEFIDLENSAFQKELLKGRSPFICNVCNVIAWVKLGYKEKDFSKYDIHLHIQTTGERSI